MRSSRPRARLGEVEPEPAPVAEHRRGEAGVDADDHAEVDACRPQPVEMGMAERSAADRLGHDREGAAARRPHPHQLGDRPVEIGEVGIGHGAEPRAMAVERGGELVVARLEVAAARGQVRDQREGGGKGGGIDQRIADADPVHPGDAIGRRRRQAVDLEARRHMRLAEPGLIARREQLMRGRPLVGGQGAQQVAGEEIGEKIAFVREIGGEGRKRPAMDAELVGKGPMAIDVDDRAHRGSPLGRRLAKRWRGRLDPWRQSPRKGQGARGWQRKGAATIAARNGSVVKLLRIVRNLARVDGFSTPKAR